MDAGASSGRLERCIRDLAALNALPSMCIGCSPDEALAIVMDALPTALSCRLVHMTLADGTTHASLGGKPVGGEALAALTQAVAHDPDAEGIVHVDAPERLWCFAADLPIGATRGRLVAGKSAPLDAETDRVLIRSAANLVGTTLATANELDTAKRKDEFLAMLGHELRNPLAPILTAVELLARHPEAARERSVIERNTRHLARLVDDLLDISRVTSGYIELRREPVALATVLERAIELASPAMIRNRQRLVTTPARDAVVEGDAVRLTQVFGNLLTNASKFTPSGGLIQLTVESTGDKVRISVRDDGRGIAGEHLARIFQPFVQIDRVADSARGGLGLGLAIVKNLVDRHAGTITVASAGLGKGTTFTVELPIAATPLMIAPASAVRPAAARRGMRVLVVDDNVDVAELLAEALKRQGFDTTLAYNGRDAIERWREFSPHAAVLDVGLPDIDGYELARTLRGEHGSEPMLIAATGYGQPADRVRAVDAGFDCHFVKPVSVQELVQALDGRELKATG